MLNFLHRALALLSTNIYTTARSSSIYQLWCKIMLLVSNLCIKPLFLHLKLLNELVFFEEKGESRTDRSLLMTWTVDTTRKHREFNVCRLIHILLVAAFLVQLNFNLKIHAYSSVLVYPRNFLFGWKPRLCCRKSLTQQVISPHPSSDKIFARRRRVSIAPGWMVITNS